MSVRRRVVRWVAVVAASGLVVPAIGATASSGGAMVPGKPGAASKPTEVNVTKDPKYRAGEPQLAINPKNPKNLVYTVVAIATTYACQKAKRAGCSEATSVYGPQPAGLIQNLPRFSQVRVYVSFDGGAKWRRVKVPLIPPKAPKLVETGDPLLTVGPDGTFHLAWDAIRFCDCKTTIIKAGGIATSKSTDGGRTWSTPVLTGTPVDRPFFAADASTGRIYEASSGQLGANSKGDPNLPEIAIGGPGGDRWLVASNDGVHWTDPKPFGGVPGFPPGTFVSAAHGMFATAFSPTDPALCGGTAGCTVFQTTTDDGATWSRHVLPLPPGASGAPLVAADPKVSGHFTVAVLNGAKTQFFVLETKDAGASWSGPTMVAEDATQTHFHPWLAYSPTGVVGLMWQTNVTGGPTSGGGLPAALPEAVEGQAATPTPYNVWAAISDDGGATFTKPLEISSANSPAPQAFLPFGVADDFSFIALSGTQAFVGWADYRPGDRQGFFSAIKLDAFRKNS